MPVALKPPIDPRERILGFGLAGTGKSHAILCIARRCPDVQFYVMDNDMAYARLLATEFTDLSNVDVREVDSDDWEMTLETVGQIHREMKRDDWCVLDSTTPTWQAVQGWFTEQVFDEGIEDYFLEVRKMKTSKKEKGKDVTLGAFEGFMDWPVINKQFAKMHRLIMRTPGHLYCTAELANVSNKDDDKQTLQVYGTYGVKPAGQKRMPHLFQTTLLFTKNRVGEYFLTTIKDRGRPEQENMEMEDFAKDYLMAVAGWKYGRPAA